MVLSFLLGKLGTYMSDLPLSAIKLKFSENGRHIKAFTESGEELPLIESVTVTMRCGDLPRATVKFIPDVSGMVFDDMKCIIIKEKEV